MLDDPIQNEATKANHERIKRLYAYFYKIADCIINSVAAQSPGYKGVIAAVYMRAYYCLSSLAKLDRPGDFQAVQATERTLFELYVDIVLLKKDPDLWIKFSAFNRLALMRYALQLSAFIEKNPSDRLKERYSGELEIATDQSKLAECKELLELHYNRKGDDIKLPKSIPENWTGMDLACRITAIGETEGLKEDLVLMEYYRTEVCESNWHVHGGGVCANGRSPEMFASNWSDSLGSSFGLLCRMTCIAFKELELLDLVPDLKSSLGSVYQVE